MNDIQNTLLEMELTKPEATVYLELLKIGQATVSAIASRANLKRGHTYNILNELMQKGIATQVIKAKVKHFSVCDPKELINLLDRQKRELEEKKQKMLDILPQLQSIKNPLAHRPKVHFFEGEQGIREMYEDTLKGNHKELYAFADFKYIVPLDKPRSLNEWIWKYADRRAAKGIWYLGIVKLSEETMQAYRTRGAQKRKLKFVGTKINIPAEINVYGDKVAIFSEYEELIGVIIESHTIAETLINIHKTLWNFLPGKPPIV